jgi:hypothetical protein
MTDVLMHRDTVPDPPHCPSWTRADAATPPGADMPTHAKIVTVLLTSATLGVKQAWAGPSDDRPIYGPYADALRNVLLLLEGHYISGLGDDATTPTAKLELLPGAREEAESFLAAKPATKQHIDRVLQLIEGFEDAYGLELLATTHWVMRERTAEADDIGAVARAVQSWSRRKATTMKEPHIAAAWQRLRESGWPLERAARARA